MFGEPHASHLVLEVPLQAMGEGGDGVCVSGTPRPWSVRPPVRSLPKGAWLLLTPTVSLPDRLQTGHSLSFCRQCAQVQLPFNGGNRRYCLIFLRILTQEGVNRRKG